MLKNDAHDTKNDKSLTYMALSAAWRIKESLPHVLLYLIVRYRPDGHFSRKSFRK